MERMAGWVLGLTMLLGSGAVPADDGSFAAAVAYFDSQGALVDRCAEALRAIGRRFDPCEDESYEAFLAYLSAQGGEPEPLPLAARLRRRVRVRRWVPLADHTELGFVT